VSGENLRAEPQGFCKFEHHHKSPLTCRTWYGPAL